MLGNTSPNSKIVMALYVSNYIIGMENGEPIRSEVMKTLKNHFFFFLAEVSFHISESFPCHCIVKLEEMRTTQFHRAGKFSNSQSSLLLLNTAEKNPPFLFYH